MYSVHRIAALDLPELAPYRTLRLPQDHRARGIFVAEGDKVVHRLLASSVEIISVLIPEHRLAEYEPALRTRAEEIQTFCVTEKRILEELVGFEMFQGVMAVAKIPTPLTLEALLGNTTSPRLLVAADGLTSAENVGVLVRNCVAFGAQALITGETSASPYLRRAVRNSMGTVFQLPIFESTDLVKTIQALRTSGVRSVAAHPHTDQKLLAEVDFSTDTCVIFGAEGNGILATVIAACDEAVAIPMSASVDSLNVASAAAVFLYEASRQQKLSSAKRRI